MGPSDIIAQKRVQPALDAHGYTKCLLNSEWVGKDVP